jgi:uncharacterized protein YndB with AHSA1/START domain
MASTIHQEITLKAKPDRVFAALTDAEQFGKVSGAPAEISPKAGASFSIFGGMIHGRNIEVVPGGRLVQAWRVKGWPEGVYSLVRFDLRGENGGTRVVLDHTGYPEGADEHLAPGWKTNYWEPLEKYFS